MCVAMARILLADDELKLAKFLATVLEGQGHQVVRVEDGKAAVRALAEGRWDLVITDLRMPGVDGMGVLRAAQKEAPSTDVVVMTAHGSQQIAVEAMKEGAYDYLVKPVVIDEFRLRIAKILERRALIVRADDLERKLDQRDGLPGIVARSERMRATVEAAMQVAQSEAAVLLLGESGTGKSLLARAIHRASPRRDRPFVEVHCAALPDTLLESELFGHEKGAFTGAEQAKAGQLEAGRGGTIFLDEIGEITPATQVKLLRFLQQREVVRLGSTEARKVDVRVVAATNRDLEEARREGRFREDFYYRLSVFPIQVPPLRDRVEDVPELVARFLETRGQAPTRLEPEAAAALVRYRWPGNVRELENVLERALILAGQRQIAEAHLPATLRGGVAAPDYADVLADGFNLDRFEQGLIAYALSRSGGNKAAAARMLGISRRRLYTRLSHLDVGAEPADPTDDEGT
jgi:DNA-binding NtrC family response regulator